MPKGQYQRKPKQEPTETGERPIVSAPASTTPAVLLSMKGWSAITDGLQSWVLDDVGRKLGTFNTPAEAIRFLENSSRHIRTR